MMWPNPFKKDQIPARKPMGLHNKCKKIDETQWVRRLQKRNFGSWIPLDLLS